MRRTLWTTSVLLAALGMAQLPGAARAASHREAPITALDRTADITDFYAFVSYDNAAKATFILNVDPLLEPSNGPNYFPFDDNILYSINVDNKNDALAHVSFQFRFHTEIRQPGLFQGYAGIGANGANAPSNSPAPVAPGTPIVPPAITALDGPGSAGINLRQTYTVTMVTLNNDGTTTSADLGGGQTLFAVPTNVGPRTMPNYAALRAQGVYTLPNGIRTFAGTADDPFYIDLGAAFDTLNLRASAFTSGVPGVLTPAQDANDNANITSDSVSGFNVNSIAIEVPTAMLTSGHNNPAATDPTATIGSWGTTSRPRETIRRSPIPSPAGSPLGTPPTSQPALQSNTFRQVQRMGNPLINELIIGTGSKDLWSMSQPVNDADFANFALDPLFARVLNALYGGALPIPTPPRTDLLLLVQYMPPIAATGTPAGPIADLLRLNTGVPPTAQASRKRLGVLAGDNAGFPNGRRVSDDVTDITLRVVAGVLSHKPGDPNTSGFPNNSLGDGVNTNDVPYLETFPYVGLAQSGRDRRHVDPGEPGGGPVTGPQPAAADGASYVAPTRGGVRR